MPSDLVLVDRNDVSSERDLGLDPLLVAVAACVSGSVGGRNGVGAISNV